MTESEMRMATLNLARQYIAYFNRHAMDVIRNETDDMALVLFIVASVNVSLAERVDALEREVFRAG